MNKLLKKAVSASVCAAITAGLAVVPAMAEQYTGTLQIGQTVKFDFGAEGTETGYLNVSAGRDYYSSSAAENGLTYGFLGVGSNPENVSFKTDSFEMLKGQTNTVLNGGVAGSAASDNVYAYNNIYAPGTENSYDMGDAVMPVRFALKADRHSYYRVKATLSSSSATEDAVVSLYNEKRHPIITNTTVKAGQPLTVEFTANVMDVVYKTSKPPTYEDDMLNIAVAGTNAGLAALEITRLPEEYSEDTAQSKPVTIWCCTDSTGCDQASVIPFYPLQNYSGVGQGLSKYLNKLTISNQGEGGLASNDNAHFNSAVAQMQKGDYLYVEYGHNENNPEEYSANLEKYYTAAHEKGVTLIIVGPIDRTQPARWDESNKKWKPSLDGYSSAGKAFVESKISSGATDIAFIDLNAAWVNFLDSETNRIADRRVALGLDSAKTLDTPYIRYYYTYNKRGAADRTHINDYGAENAAYIFYQQVKAAVQAGEAEGATASQKLQASLLKPIADDVNDRMPLLASDDIISAGFAPNSKDPANFTTRTPYNYSLNIENITQNENGTLKSARVHVLQNVEAYAAVYVTAYDKDNNELGTIVSSGNNGRIDNTADGLGDVKELEFNSDIVPDHFSAVMYYVDENNNRLTEEGMTAPASVKYESRTVNKTILSEDFSGVAELGDDADIFSADTSWGKEGSGTGSLVKRSDNDAVFAHSESDPNGSSYIWRSLGDTSVNSGILELNLKVRWRLGNGYFWIGQNRKSCNSLITLQDKNVKLNGVTAGTLNNDEWTDLKCIVDLDSGKATLTMGGYAPVTSDITINTKDLKQFGFTKSGAYDIDIDDISIYSITPHSFPDLTTYDPEDMSETLKTSLTAFGCVAVGDEIYKKSSGVYKLENANSINSTKADGFKAAYSLDANVYANINIAMDEDATKQFVLGRKDKSSGSEAPYVYYYTIKFVTGTIPSVVTEVSDSSHSRYTTTVTLVPGKWYNISFESDRQTNLGSITVTDIASGNTAAEANEINVSNLTNTSAFAYWRNADCTGNAYIANSWVYAKDSDITTDDENVTVSGVPAYAGMKADLTLTPADGYVMDGASLGNISAVNENGVWVLKDVISDGTAQKIHIAKEFTISAPDNMLSESNTLSLTSFGGSAADGTIYDKTGGAYKLNTTAAATTDAKYDITKNAAANVSIAMEQDSAARLTFGRRGSGNKPYTYYYEIKFVSGESASMSTELTDKSHSRYTTTVTLVPQKWYTLKLDADIEDSKTITLRLYDSRTGELAAENSVDSSGNAITTGGLTNNTTTGAQWNYEDTGKGTVYIAESYIYTVDNRSELDKVIEAAGENSEVVIAGDISGDNKTTEIDTSKTLVINENAAVKNSTIKSKTPEGNITVTIKNSEADSVVTGKSITFGSDGKITSAADDTVIKTSYTDENNQPVSDIGVFKTKKINGTEIKYVVSNGTETTDTITKSIGTQISGESDILFSLFVQGVPDSVSQLNVTFVD